MTGENPHIGSTFESFLVEDGTQEDVTRTVERRMTATLANTAIHPGEILADELQEANISADRLAADCGLATDLVRRIVARQDSITPAVALALAHHFKTSAAFWLNLQLAYDRKRVLA